MKSILKDKKYTEGGQEEKLRTIYRQSHFQRSQMKKCSHGINWLKRIPYDMVPQSLMIGILEMYKISDKIVNIITTAMENCAFSKYVDEGHHCDIEL